MSTLNPEIVTAGAKKFTREALVKGQPTKMDCFDICGQHYVVSGGAVTIASLEDEWYDDVRNPEAVIERLGRTPSSPDLFTFWQRYPDTRPAYPFLTEFESLAVLPVSTFDHWWNHQIKGARTRVRKSQKAGVEVREAVYDDAFVHGMTEIFNETPVRQGRRFWHYGKDFDTVKRQFSQFLFRETLIGAYYRGELIGFAMLANAQKYGVLGQFIAKLEHRDKAVNNALMACAVQACERRQIPFLIYGSWQESSLADFKRHSGFQEAKVPRYFVPLTRKGELALKFGLHRGFKSILPDRLTQSLKAVRSWWCELRAR